MKDFRIKFMKCSVFSNFSNTCLNWMLEPWLVGAFYLINLCSLVNMISLRTWHQLWFNISEQVSKFQGSPASIDILFHCFLKKFGNSDIPSWNACTITGKISLMQNKLNLTAINALIVHNMKTEYSSAPEPRYFEALKAPITIVSQPMFHVSC